MIAAEPSPKRPVLLGLYHVVALDDDRVQVANAGRSVVISGPGLASKAVALLAALDGEATTAELEDRFPGLASRAVASLAAKGLVVDGGPGLALAIGPGPSLTATALGLSPAMVARRLASATVVVVGCDPVSGAVAVYLARAGLGHLVLIDHQEISARDLATSAALGPLSEGQPRAEAYRRLCQTNATEVTLGDEAMDPQALGGADLAIIAAAHRSPGAAWPEADACLRAALPFLVHGQDSLEATVGPLVAAGGRPCHRCMEARRLSHVTHPAENLAYQNHRARVDPGPDTFLAAHTGVVAGLVASEALRALLGARPVTSGAVVFVDLDATRLDRYELLAVPGCGGCAAAGPPSST